MKADSTLRSLTMAPAAACPMTIAGYTAGGVAAARAGRLLESVRD